MTTKKMISGMMVLQTKSNRVKSRINPVKVVMRLEVVNRDQTITMVAEEVQVIVTIETNTIKEEIKVTGSDHLSEVEDEAITEEEVEEDTVIVVVTISKYLMTLNTDHISIDARMTMNQVMLTTKV